MKVELCVSKILKNVNEGGAMDDFDDCINNINESIGIGDTYANEGCL
jgi:hypothetical protein